MLLKRIIALMLFAGLAFACKSWEEVVEPEARKESRSIENFGNNWEFRRLENLKEKGTGWEKVNIPHSVKIEPLVVNDQWQGTALYRKTFEVSNLNDHKWFIHFEGVMQEAQVTINGFLVKTHKGGFLPFTVDATPFLEEGENNIEVEVKNVDDPTIPPGKALGELDFNMYGGIYRNVHLIKKNKVYITDAVNAAVEGGGGIYFHTATATKKVATGKLTVHVQNGSQREQSIKLQYSLLTRDGDINRFYSSSRGPGHAVVEAGETASLSLNFKIENPLLWSVDEPNLYTLTVDILADDKLVDTQSLKVGLREIALSGEAFFLNGEELFINGTNRHQEYPYIGYALSDEAQYRDAYKIKQAGFNFVRLSHYPHATAFLKACDELGLLVMNAIPGWQFFEEGEFEENAIRDIREMAKRDRNHPSVVFWENSLNESGMTEEFMERANEVLKAELPYPDTFTAGWIDHPSYDLFIPARQHAKPPLYWNGYNTPNRPLLIAEYGDWEYYAHNAGFNQTLYSDLQEEERSSRKLRSTGEAGLLQQALNYQEAFNSNLKGKQTIGHANWLIFDYNRGYANDLEASGISDIFRIPKFSFFFYRSQKSPGEGEFKEPMVFIASYWTPRSTTSVKVFSNTQEVALYLNGELIDQRTPEINEISYELPHPPFIFNLDRYVPGTLKAVGIIDGEEVATHVVRTPRAPAGIQLAVDYSQKIISPNSPDMFFVYAMIVDEEGTVVPTANQRIAFSLGDDAKNARIIGGKVVKAEAGIATILIRTERFSGSLNVRATAEGLGEQTIEIRNP
ncbi:beta-galactosidase [Antarcticibacterium sp. W02-3]|uniref:glycoside hydrolase family 2 TIM barrel-domain containing protein n=1 Tax=Antarcticibacterium sp. W02-3 TaxID=2183747 RepID=UPI002043E7EC|nr:glycoside hydrolase family 2 TIM barrel-domain containing protein [Antarcticibacterium sp. W02-3]MCM4160197.1 beta-galactosidase [Antarcticibacterium sp. W02-3]